MKNFLKGLGFLTPFILALIGVLLFCMYDPVIVVIFKIMMDVFCGLLGLVFVFTYFILISWGLKNALLHILKIDLKVKK